MATYDEQLSDLAEQQTQLLIKKVTLLATGVLEAMKAEDLTAARARSWELYELVNGLYSSQQEKAARQATKEEVDAGAEQEASPAEQKT